jgi:hypothetical protein
MNRNLWNKKLMPFFLRVVSSNMLTSNILRWSSHDSISTHYEGEEDDHEGVSSESGTKREKCGKRQADPLGLLYWKEYVASMYME